MITQKDSDSQVLRWRYTSVPAHYTKPTTDSAYNVRPGLTACNA